MKYRDMEGLDETAVRYLRQLRLHGFIGAAACEADIPMHKIRAMRRRDPMFDQAVRYLGWVGRGFCDVTAGSEVDDIPAVKRYLARLGIEG